MLFNRRTTVSLRSAVAATIAVAAALALLAPGRVLAQPTPDPAAATAPASGSPLITLPPPDHPAGALEARPPLYYFINKGTLQPVVGISFEDLEQMLRRKEEVATERRKPDYRFETLAATGTADAAYARIDVKFVVFVDAAGWVRVPLDLQGAVLEKQIAYKGPGKYAMQYDAERREYAVWLQGAGDQPHEITLKTVTPLEQVSGQRRLRLNLPRAWTSSLSLAVPETNVVAQVSTGAVIDSVAAEGKGSRLKASGIGGAFQLTWGVVESANASRPRVQVLLEAKADVSAVVDARSIAYETEITVNSFGGEFDSFLVQLPPSSVLVEEPLADIETIKQSPKNKNDKEVVYQVRRISGSAKSMTVKLKALRSLEQSKGGREMFDFGGFEVVGAVRQWGYLGIAVEGDWQLLWGDRSRVRQVDAAPAFLQSREGASIFEYYGRPFTLQARLVPRETRVSIDPEYTVDVTTERAFLTAKLKYRVGGAKVFALPVQMLDWQVDEVGPVEIVDARAVVLNQSSPLTIALLQPAIGDFEITVRAHRDLPKDPKNPNAPLAISLPLPKPLANVVGPATFTVHAADNVELSPRDSLHTGLARRKRNDPKTPGSGTYWSYSADTADAAFKADLRPLSRSIHVRGNTLLALSREGGRVRQTFTYIVAREPVDALEFKVPIRLTDKGRLEMKVGSESISWVIVEEDAGDPTKPARIRVQLQAPKMGTFDVSADYPIPEEQPVSQASIALRVPLLAPVDGEVDENTLRIADVAGLTVQHFDETWRKVPEKADVPPTARRELVLRSGVASPETMLGIRWDDPAPIHDEIIERLWIQSIVMGSTRQERAVFRFTSSAPTVEVRLPAGATGPTASINGSVADFAEPISQRVLTLRLPTTSAPPAGIGAPPSTGSPTSASNSAAGNLAAAGTPYGSSTTNPRERRFVLDLRYRVTSADDASSSSFDPPTIDRAAAVRNVYRQVALVADQYLLDASNEYVPEYGWNWDGVFLVRRPPLSQADLENWCGARHETPLPERANVYLFSSFGAVPQLNATTMRRTTIVLGASGLVLAYCLCLLYVAPLRHPALLILLAIGVAAAGAMYPSFAPIAIQGAALGAVLAFTALLLDRNFVRRHGRAMPAKSDSVSAPTGSSARTKITQAFVPPPASTAAIDIADPLPASGSS